MDHPRDEYADWLMRLALELSGRVRQYPPDSNGVWLRAMVAGADVDPLTAYRDLCVMLAAMVPEEARASELLAWWRTEERARTALRILEGDLVAERFALPERAA